MLHDPPTSRESDRKGVDNNKITELLKIEDDDVIKNEVSNNNEDPSHGNDESTHYVSSSKTIQKSHNVEMRSTPTVEVNNRVSNDRMKYLSLLFLMVSNAAFILTVRYSRTLKGEMYIPSTAVLCNELLKLAGSLLLNYIETKDISTWCSNLYNNIIADPLTTLKVAVPAFVYVLQNNLQYVGLSNLNAGTFQVTYQLRIITTALFSVALLKRQLYNRQWLALCILFLGIVLVQLQANQSTSSESSNKQQPLVGLLAVLVASVCSGFAGVYFEKILKQSGNNEPKSVWLRNIQLALFGTSLAFTGVVINDGSAVVEKGFFYGYTPLVWVVICIQAFSGLIVAAVIKYADNIIKGFATCFSILISSLVSIYAFGFIVNIPYVTGVLCVFVATYLYTKIKIII